MNKREAAFTVLFIAAISWWCVAQTWPPRPLPETAPATSFSAARAIEHLRVIAKVPRPVGSPAHDAVRDYIFQRLTALGVEAQIQNATVVSTREGSPYTAANVSNVLGRLHGTGGGQALLMAGHYDSVSSGPGASDDGESVAMQLETLRALRAGPPLRNDVIFLFTDSEEGGTLGSKLFVEQHPWAKQLGLVMNFDTRGTSGPAIMYETSAGNGRLIHEFAVAAPYPVTSSLAYEAYKLLPNDSDLTYLKEAGSAALDFAYIDNVVFYHSQYDDLAHLDPASLQHQGSYALALARHFGNLDLRTLKGGGDASYFVLPVIGMVIYPVSWSVPLAVMAALLLAGVLALALVRRRLSGGGALLGFLEFLLLILAGCAAALGMGTLVRGGGGIWQNFAGDPYHVVLYRVAAVALAVAVTTVLYRWFRGRTSTLALWAGALLFWMLLAVATSIWMPGATYVFVWPLLAGTAGLAYAVLRNWNPKRLSLVVSLCLLPGLVLVAPLIQQLFVALTMRLAVVPVFLTVLLLGMLIPSVEVIAAAFRWWLPAAAALICAGCLAAGWLQPAFDHEHPRTNSIYYGLDTDTGKAIWFSFDTDEDTWTARYLGASPRSGLLPDYVPFLPWPFLINHAPAVALVPPAIERLEDAGDALVRTVRLRVTSPRHAPGMFLYGDARIPVLEASVNGTRIDPGHVFPELKPGQKILAFQMKRWGLRFLNVPPEGIELRMRLKGPAAGYRMEAMDQSFGIDGLPGVAPRPDTMIPFPIMTDSVFVRKVLVF